MSSAGPPKPPSLRQCPKVRMLQASSEGSGEHRLDWAGPSSWVCLTLHTYIHVYIYTYTGHTGAVQPLQLMLQCRQHPQTPPVKNNNTTVPFTCRDGFQLCDFSPHPIKAPPILSTPLWFKDLKVHPGRLEESPCTNIKVLNQSQ